MNRYIIVLLYLSITLIQASVCTRLTTHIKTAREITDQEWVALRTLFIQSFVTACCTVNEQDLALMNNDVASFWSNVFDRDKPQVIEEKYTVILYKHDNTVIAYGLYAFFNEIKYLYVRHLCVDPQYQRQSLGKKLITEIGTLHQEAQKIGLLTRTYNRAAQNFYTHLGFCITANPPSTILKFYAPDRVYLEKTINAHQ